MSPVIIVVLIILAVFGSVYMLKPSPRQQRIAKLRLEAIKLGLQVKLDSYKVDSKKMGVREDVVATRYLRFNPAVKSQQVRWCVVRQTGWEQEGLPEGWSWNSYHAKPDIDGLSEYLLQLTVDVVLIEACDNRTTLMTLEHKASTAEQINIWLDHAQQL
jgi:hypothetical protein